MDDFVNKGVTIPELWLEKGVEREFASFNDCIDVLRRVHAGEAENPFVEPLYVIKQRRYAEHEALSEPDELTKMVTYDLYLLSLNAIFAHSDVTEPPDITAIREKGRIDSDVEADQVLIYLLEQGAKVDQRYGASTKGNRNEKEQKILFMLNIAKQIAELSRQLPDSAGEDKVKIAEELKRFQDMLKNINKVFAAHQAAAQPESAVYMFGNKCTLQPTVPYLYLHKENGHFFITNEEGEPKIPFPSNAAPCKFLFTIPEPNGKIRIIPEDPDYLDATMKADILFQLGIDLDKQTCGAGHTSMTAGASVLLAGQLLINGDSLQYNLMSGHYKPNGFLLWQGVFGNKTELESPPLTARRVRDPLRLKKPGGAK